MDFAPSDFLNPSPLTRDQVYQSIAKNRRSQTHLFSSKLLPNLSSLKSLEDIPLNQINNVTGTKAFLGGSSTGSSATKLNELFTRSDDFPSESECVLNDRTYGGGGGGVSSNHSKASLKTTNIRNELPSQSDHRKMINYSQQSLSSKYSEKFNSILNCQTEDRLKMVMQKARKECDAIINGTNVDYPNDDHAMKEPVSESIGHCGSIGKDVDPAYMLDDAKDIQSAKKIEKMFNLLTDIEHKSNHLHGGDHLMLEQPAERRSRQSMIQNAPEFGIYAISFYLLISVTGVFLHFLHFGSSFLKARIEYCMKRVWTKAKRTWFFEENVNYISFVYYLPTLTALFTCYLIVWLLYTIANVSLKPVPKIFQKYSKIVKIQ